MPKSRTFARPSRVIMMLAGLMSRWTMPLACAAASAAATCAPYSSAVAIGSGALREHPIERRALDQLHRDEGRARVLVDVVDRDDVRVVEGGGRARLLHEPPVAIGIGRRFWRQHLDGDGPAEPRIDGAVDHAHAAAADFGFETVV